MWLPSSNYEAAGSLRQGPGAGMGDVIGIYCADDPVPLFPSGNYTLCFSVGLPAQDPVKGIRVQVIYLGGSENTLG